MRPNTDQRALNVAYFDGVGWRQEEGNVPGLPGGLPASAQRLVERGLGQQVRMTETSYRLCRDRGLLDAMPVVDVPVIPRLGEVMAVFIQHVSILDANPIDALGSADVVDGE